MGIASYVSGADKVVVKAVDNITNEKIEVEVDSQSNSKRNIAGSRTNATGEYQSIYRGFSGSQKSLENLAYSEWTYRQNVGLKANLSIIGNPYIEVMDTCQLTVMLKEGKVHHSSGIYIVHKVMDQISKGTYLTQLELSKSGDLEGSNVS